jgi:glycerophosphoryl diester phosphodiesterase
MGPAGARFIKECREAGKEITVWTVNDVHEIKIAMGWGIKAILTDHVAAYDKLKKEVSSM